MYPRSTACFQIPMPRCISPAATMRCALNLVIFDILAFER